MSSIALNLVFGLLLIVLVAGSVTAAVVAARHTGADWHPAWLRRATALGAGAVGTFVLWVSAMATVPA
ncbi:MAG: hypothetical protein GC157_02070 [Frankiales bacterium]|nr:hypothetical protein [Frankiales bacterium]